MRGYGALLFMPLRVPSDTPLAVVGCMYDQTRLLVWHLFQHSDPPPHTHTRTHTHTHTHTRTHTSNRQQTAYSNFITKQTKQEIMFCSEHVADNWGTDETTPPNGVVEEWLAAIQQAMRAALPVFKDVMKITAKDAHQFHMFGGDVVIMTDGTAKIIEFNDWPGLTWRNYWNLPDTQRRRVKLGHDGEIIPVSCRDGPDCGGENQYNVEVAETLSDLFAMVLGLNNPDTLNHVREILPL
jgi:hypothetical protein